MTIPAWSKAAVSDLVRREVFIHRKACIDSTVTIGDRTKIWQFASITRNARIGSDCTIAPHVSLDGCIIGDRCIARPSVDIGPGIEVGSDVFLGPLVCLANDRFPATDKRGWEGEKLLKGEMTVIRIHSHVILGAHSVVLPGVTIGSWSCVSAGAICDRDVPEHSLFTREGTIVPLDWEKQISRRMRPVRE